MRPTTKPTLFLLPGLLCDAGIWQHQSAALGEMAEIVVPDFRFARSITGMAEIVLNGAPEHFSVAGHSMGGRVATEIMRRAAERVVGLALLDTAYKPLQPGEAGEREKAERAGYVHIAQTQGMRAMARTWLQKMVHPSRLTDAPLVESIVEMMGRKTPEIFAGQIKALLGRPDATPVLAAIRCPTLVLCGREDAWSVVDVHRDMAARIPNARLVIIEDCGHMATMERPYRVTAALAEWFKGLPD